MSHSLPFICLFFRCCRHKRQNRREPFVRWFDIKVSIVHEKSRAHKEKFTHLIDTTLMGKLTQRNHHYSHIKNMFIPIEMPMLAVYYKPALANRTSTSVFTFHTWFDRRSFYANLCFLIDDDWMILQDQRSVNKSWYNLMLISTSIIQF
jgi:hypothetical protein